MSVAILSQAAIILSISFAKYSFEGGSFNLPSRCLMRRFKTPGQRADRTRSFDQVGLVRPDLNDRFKIETLDLWSVIGFAGKKRKEPLLFITEEKIHTGSQGSELFTLDKIGNERRYHRSGDIEMMVRSLVAKNFFSQRKCDFDDEVANSF